MFDTCLPDNFGKARGAHCMKIGDVNYSCGARVSRVGGIYIYIFVEHVYDQKINPRGKYVCFVHALYEFMALQGEQRVIGQ